MLLKKYKIKKPVSLTKSEKLALFIIMGRGHVELSKRAKYQLPAMNVQRVSGEIIYKSEEKQYLQTLDYWLICFNLYTQLINNTLRIFTRHIKKDQS